MASFVVLPLVLHQHSGLENSEQWKLYLPVLLLSILLMTPFVMRSDKHQAFLVLYPLNIILLLLSQAILLYSHESLAFIATALLIFFVAFNFLEASLPANISKFVATDRKGTALGVFSTCQFFGAFCGGLAGGGAYSFAGFNGVFSLNLLVCLIWIGGVVWYRGTLKSGLRVAIKP